MLRFSSSGNVDKSNPWYRGMSDVNGFNVTSETSMHFIVEKICT